MRRLSTCAAATLVLLTSAAAHGGSARHCTTPNDLVASNLRVTNLSCATGRRVLRHYVGRATCYRGGCTTDRFRCRRTVLGYESYRAFCARGTQRVRFDYGA